MKKILMGMILISTLLQTQNVYAAEVTSFEVQLGNTEAIEQGEPVDLIITAIDSDSNIVEDYTGSILVFSETDPKAELSNDFEFSVYEFNLADNGVATLEDGIIFHSVGLHSIDVYDLNDETDSIFGTDEILVEGKNDLTQEDNFLISFLDAINEEEDNNELTNTSLPTGLVNLLEEPINEIAIESTTETQETVSESNNVGDMILTSYRKKREYNRGITRTVNETKDESVQDKVMDMIFTSFRKVREYNKGITRAVNKTEELSVVEKVTDMILTSFRIETNYIRRNR